ncbi:hypothetical protein COU75_04580 [Candidatus Peregrinibacteria bacterium CG10_big_fil_rev_8_21_14_0_10_42_8]|nr:MAG: hypothetical protein COU75_04580 [Candidatus Peregrinibacteria bacterium CG10_big_fil_rev_8_21_14_0_10_42_8]
MRTLLAPSTVLLALLIGFFVGAMPEMVTAQVYGGPGIIGGISQAQAILGISNGDLRGTILSLLFAALSFMALAAFVVIVIAGIYLVLSLGDEGQKDKAKKIIGYAAGGLIVIALAAAIVGIVITATNGEGLFGPLPAWPTGTDPRAVILGVLLGILLFMGLAAVVIIVIAGIILIFSLGNEGSLDQVKRIILYAVSGLIIIALAAGIVTFIINAIGAGSLFGTVPSLGNTGGTDLRTTVLAILQGILNFMALAAVVVIVIAGIILVVSGGEESSKDKAKRIIFYAILGLLVIALASAIVGFINSAIL